MPARVTAPWTHASAAQNGALMKVCEKLSNESGRRTPKKSASKGFMVTRIRFAAGAVAGGPAAPPAATAPAVSDPAAVPTSVPSPVPAAAAARSAMTLRTTPR